MSLLFDALKRAQESDDGAEAKDDSQFIDLSMPEPTNPVEEIPVKDAGVLAARSILTATARLPRRIVLFVVGGLVVLLVAGGGGFWYYQRAVGSLSSQQTAIAPAPPPANVEPPLTEIVPVPPTPAPPAANSAAQGPETGTAADKPEVVKPEVDKPAEVQPAEAKPAEVSPAEAQTAKGEAKPGAAEEIAPAPKSVDKVAENLAPAKEQGGGGEEEATPAQQEAPTYWISPRQRARQGLPANDNAPPPTQAAVNTAPSHIQLSPTVDPLREAYKALTEGRMGDAERFYQDVITRTPHERDALLGLAVIAHRKGQTERALDLYRQVLAEDPGNATATAAMVNLTMQADPVAAESRLKLLLDRNPTAPELYHVLGRVFALQKRWSEAQQAFFQAFTHDPGNAQYAYNLAVSLDHLHKPAAAIPYYEKSIQILKPGDPALDRLAIRRRVQELQNSLPP